MKQSKGNNSSFSNQLLQIEFFTLTNNEGELVTSGNKFSFENLKSKLPKGYYLLKICFEHHSEVRQIQIKD